jgi:hypothetical protein
VYALFDVFTAKEVTLMNASHQPISKPIVENRPQAALFKNSLRDWQARYRARRSPCAGKSDPTPK